MAADGILFAPEAFNLIWQARVEGMICELHLVAKAGGGEVLVKAVSTSHERTKFGGSLLSRVDYEITLRDAAGRPVETRYVSISVDPPPGGKIFDAEVRRVLYRR